MDEQIKVAKKLQSKLSKKFPTKMDWTTNIAKLAMVEIMDIGSKGFDIINNSALVEAAKVNKSTIMKIKFILGWLRENSDILELNEGERKFIDCIPAEMSNEVPTVTSMDDNSSVTYSTTCKDSITMEKESITTSIEKLGILNEPGTSGFGELEKEAETEVVITKELEMNINNIDNINDEGSMYGIQEEDINDDDMLDSASTLMKSLKRKVGEVDLHRENIKVRLDNKRQVKKVFHHVLEKPFPENWKPWSSKLMEPIILVTHPVMQVEDLYKKISSGLKSNELEPFPARIIKSVDAIRVVCADTNDIDEAKKKLSKWNSSIIIKDPGLYEPKIRFSSISMVIRSIEEAKEVAKRIIIQNGCGGKGDWKVEAFYVSRSKFTDIIMSVSPRIRDHVQERRGVFYLDFKPIRVNDYFHFNVCYRCYSYSHSTKKCNNQQVCRYCAESHDERTCVVRMDPKKYICYICRRNINNNNNSININHTPVSWECIEYQRRLRNAIQRVNYDYEWIIRD